jgi:UDP-N-acetylglucosamine 2-epimerase
MSKKTVIISGIRPTFQIYEELKKHYEVAVYDQQAAGQISAHFGQAVICPAGGAGQPLFEKARNDTAHLVARATNRSIPFSFSVNGTSSDVGGWLPGMTMAYSSDVLVSLRVLDAYADTADVAGVVVHEDVTPRFRALALWAKARGVPLIHVPHGNCFAQSRPDIHDETVADWILAASPYMRNWYTARGFDRKCIKLVGYPAWDGWIESRPSQDLARRVLHLDADKPTIALCTGWPQRTNLVDDHEMIEVAVNVALEAARANDWQVIWKLHPGDGQGQEERSARLMGSYRLDGIVTRDHLTLTFVASDVVLSVGPSNVLVEAGLADKPPVLFNLRGYGFDREPPWVVGPDVANVTDVIGGLLDGSAWQDSRMGFVRRYAHKNDGKAIKRTVRAIKRIVNER